jgi:hypothetical protein
VYLYDGRPLVLEGHPRPCNTQVKQDPRGGPDCCAFIGITNFILWWVLRIASAVVVLDDGGDFWTPVEFILPPATLFWNTVRPT